MTRTNPVRHDMELACSVLACAAGARRGGGGGEGKRARGAFWRRFWRLPGSPVLLYVVLYKIISTFESADKILTCEHSNKSC